MRHIKSLFYLTAFALIMLSCEKDENKVTFVGSTAPVLTLSSTADLVLTKAKENYSSIQLQWTNPSYEFSNGTNTQDVYYTLQIDTTGSGFTNPKKATLAFTKDVSTSFTVKGLNNTLSGLELKDFVAHPFEFRIQANFSNGALPVYSNVVKVNITTYLDVVYPVPAKLFITGAATPKSWMAGGDAEVASQKFTLLNSYTFVLNGIQLTGGNQYLLVPVYGNWDNKYGSTTGSDGTNNPSGDTFKPGGNNFIAPAASGTYKITVNFKTGKFIVE